MEDITKTPPPVMTPSSIGEMGTHMSYLRRDVDGVLTVLKDMAVKMDVSSREVNTKLDVMRDSFITRSEFGEHKKDIEKLASKDDVDFLKRIIFGACAFILNL